MRYKIFTSTSSFESNHLFSTERFEISNNPRKRKLTEDEIVGYLEGVDGLIAGLEPLTEQVFELSPSLKVISRVGTGLDNVDVLAAERRGIKVFNTPDGPVESVAELSLAMILNLLRKVSNHNSLLKKKEWRRVKGSLLAGKKVGIIGFGRIGRRLARLLEPFNVGIILHDVYHDPGFNNYASTLEELLKNSDIISLHLPKTNCGYYLDKKELDCCKDGSVLLNLSRGGMVNENYLYELLTNGKISAAGLDVYEEEPYTGRLRDLENVILTPHIGSLTYEAREQMEYEASCNLINNIGLLSDYR